ncbi:MAG: hypothetical protein PHC84_05895 [Clostridia bacterium]|nr:hypothetical protein [Clostridia bacterium]
MKKVALVVLVVLLLSVISVSAAGFGYERPAWADMPENTNSNLKYFGYYHFGDAIDEVAADGNTNLTKIDAEDIEDIEHYYQTGFYIFIMIRHIFFSSGETPDDWEQRWQTAKTELAPYMDRIIGFYVDEPIHTGKSIEAFHFACQKVRQDFPEKRMMAVMTYFALTMSDTYYHVNAAEYFRYCTDVGYDFYCAWDDGAVKRDVERLKNKIAVYGQDIWLIPKAFYSIDPKKDVNFLYEPKDLRPGDDIINWIKGSYKLAVSDERIVGLFCFCYGSGSDYDNYDIILRRFFDENDSEYRKEIKDIYLQIGKAVINNDK